MPLLHIDASTVSQSLEAFDAALSGQTPGAPVVFLIHGFRYAPGVPGFDPHGALYAWDPAPAGPRVVSWPRHLGITTGGHALAVGFGWNGRGTVWNARREAARAGEVLSALICRAATRAGAPRIGLLAHSLGARVALAAIAALPRAIPVRAVLLAPSEARSAARSALDGPSGARAEVVNVISRENWLFDGLTELSGGARPFGALGRGIGRPHPRALDLDIDRVADRAALARLGFRLPPAKGRVCHWSTFLRPGVFALYRALLTEPVSLALTELATTLSRERDARRNDGGSGLGPSGLPLPQGTA
jgi:hypothetical protein